VPYGLPLCHHIHIHNYHIFSCHSNHQSNIILFNPKQFHTYLLLVFWPHSVFGQNHLCVTMLHWDSTIQKCFTVRRFPVPCQPSGRSSHPIRTTICHCSIRPNGVPYRPDSRQTKHHPSGRRVSPSRPSTVSRRFYPAYIRPDVSAARPDDSQYSISFRFLSKFQERED